MAASVVAHADQKFPGLMRDYEIWNEPELAISLCVSDPTTRLNTYVSMFAAAASAMHSQASADGQTIRTGGPVISQLSVAPTWIPALLNNGSTAPYVNFVSFHLYITGQTDIWDGMDWPTLYSVTQSSTKGLAYYYKKLEPLVRNGSQPSAWSTPIYITEYNDNWAYLIDCCRNDPTYGPLWNSVAIADLLNVVYSGGTAVPSQLSYFSATGSYFCLMGTWNWDMDCNSSALDPYPQFYAFKLFASPGYLNLQNGGHMAASVSPGSTTTGLNSTAFYTSAGDDMVIINPTSNNSSVKAVFNNAGISPASGTMYLLNSSNGQISSQSVGLTSISGGYSTQVTVPAYSTVAIAIKSGTGSTTTTGGTGSTGSTGSTGTAPKAVLTVSSQSGAPPFVVTANSSASTGGGTAIVGRSTSFGDGTWVSWQSNPSHTYTKAGTYTIVVTIKNQAGQVSTASKTVTVQQATTCYLCS